MQLLKVITDEEFGKKPDYQSRHYWHRENVRGILLDSDQKIALLCNGGNGNYWELPGGGVEKGETIEFAVRRELKEETGANSTIEKEVGLIIEKRFGDTDWETGLIQHVYSYICNINGPKGEPELTPQEIESGMQVHWLEVEDALEKLKQSATPDYASKFIVRRDFDFLKKAQVLLDQPLLA